MLNISCRATSRFFFMNIFVLDTNPRVAASYLHPKLRVKMPLETCQMVATALSSEFFDWGTIPKKDGSPYKPCFKNHPCTRWARQNIYNLAWLIEHGLAICFYYTKLYGKVHSCENSLRVAEQIFKSKTNLWPSEVWHYHTQFTFAGPAELKNHPDIVEAYREFMHQKSYTNWEKYPDLRPNWW